VSGWQRRHVAAVDGQPALGWFEKAGADVEKRRLAGAGGAEQGQELAGRDVEVRRPQRRDAAE
jgi:hypothetical protein